MQEPPPYISQLHHHSVGFSESERFGLIMFAAILLGLLSVAAWLSPSPTGMGTHQQLGLPPCTMSYVLGIRCPGCGMTTSWAHTLNGDLASGLRSNCSGVMLCFLAMWMVPCLLWLAIRGRPSRSRWVSRSTLVLMIGIVSISVIEWLIRLASG
ncbi:MAG: DUF2752 domain-containing protein [Pirellula sp.]